LAIACKRSGVTREQPLHASRKQKIKTMIRRTTGHWDFTQDLEGLLYFAQRFNELLFDYTIDTYKYFTLNSAFLCIEARQMISFVEGEIIDSKNLEAVLEEVNWSVSNDKIVKSILGNMFEMYFPLNDFENKQDIKLKLDIILNKLHPFKYFSKTKELLREAIKQGHKKEIDHYATNLVTSLVNMGYHQNYLFHSTISFFHDNRKPINTYEKIDDFLNLFNFKKNKYSVVFIASKIFNEIKDTCGKFKLEILDNLQNNDGNSVVEKYLQKKSNDEIFVLCNDLEEKEPQSARKVADARIQRVANLFSYFHHKDAPNWKEEVLIIDTERKSYDIFSLPTSPMVKGEDLLPKKAAAHLNQMIRHFGLGEKSFRKFNRAIELHGQAVSNRVPENQLLNIWISFETLIEGSKNKSKIESIIDGITPFLTLTYLRRIFRYIAKALKRWDGSKFKTFLSELPSDVASGIEEKTALLITGEEFEDNRNRLYAELSKFPLLRFRIFSLHEKLKDAKKISNFILRHEIKIKWHIRRIYRARNLIVHEGAIDRNIEILIENAHSYFDAFTNGLIYLVLEGKQIKSIEEGIREAQLLEEFWLKKLKEMDTNKVNSNNYKILLFGEN